MVLALRAALARLVIAVLAATATIPAVALAGAPIALAGVDCSIGDPPWYEVSVSNKDVRNTHQLAYVTIPPGGSATRTITRSTTLTGSIQIEVGAQADAGIIIASASVKVGVTLKGEASATDGSSVSITAPNNTSKYHDYVFFGGTRTANGRWTRYYCSVGVAKVSSSGTWFSWNAQYFGAIRCDHDSVIKNQYGQWSIQHEAATSC